MPIVNFLSSTIGLTVANRYAADPDGVSAFFDDVKLSQMKLFQVKFSGGVEHEIDVHR